MKPMNSHLWVSSKELLPSEGLEMKIKSNTPQFQYGPGGGAATAALEAPW